MVKWATASIRKLETHATQPWYPLALGLIAAVDNFIFVVPMVAFAVSTTLLAPRRWISIAFFIAVGNALGAGIFAYIANRYGLSFILAVCPSMLHHSTWKVAERWFQDYGLWGLFLNSCLPLTDHPMLAMAGLAKIAIPKIFLASLCGKIIKFFTLGWLASHAPGVLFRFNSFKKEVKNLDPKKL